jgi:hypothetical protein
MEFQIINLFLPKVKMLGTDYRHVSNCVVSYITVLMSFSASLLNGNLTVNGLSKGFPIKALRNDS